MKEEMNALISHETQELISLLEWKTVVDVTGTMP